GVLLIHISGFYWAQPAKDPSLGHLLTFTVTNEAVRFALFGFMFISGLLLTVRHGGNFHAGPFLAKRVRTILVPYLAWVVLYFLLSAHSNSLVVTQLSKAAHGSFNHIKIVASWVLFGTWQHLYFINMLFQMYLLYTIFQRPLSAILARKQAAIALVLCLLLLYPLWVYFRFMPYRHPGVALPHVFVWMTKNANRLAFEWLVPFTFGLAVGAYYTQFLAWVHRYRTVLTVVTLAALGVTVTIAATPWITAHRTADMVNYGWPYSYLHPLFRLVYAFGFNCLIITAAANLLQRFDAAQLRWLPLTQRFAAVSFGVYLFHPVVLDVLRRLHFPGSAHGISYSVYNHSAYLYLLFTTIVVTGISFFVVDGMSRLGKRHHSLQWLYTTLFGR
ncbi:MAG TPA: acyltransferase, partial [Armatimonadota bacterium]|nr:acyltransferase [Armatimonadota bacterium]